MSRYDPYCAICGGPFDGPFWDEDGDPEMIYDPEVLSDYDDPELRWLRDISIIGENPEAPTPSKIWTSNAVDNLGFGRMEYEVDDDPAFIDMPDSGEIEVYVVDSENPFAAPFHTRCREILCRYMGIRELDRDIFFKTLKGIGADHGSGCLSLDYGSNGCMGAEWWTLRDEEYLVFNPFEVKGLSEFYNNLPVLKTDTSDATRLLSTKGDPFATLPPCILLLILSHFKSAGTICKLRQSSPAVANLELGNGFWRRRLKEDMPWLWDLPTPPSPQLKEVDWKQVYHRLDWGSRKYTANKTKFHGLCNRKRIWQQMCPHFAKRYAEHAANAET